MDQILREPGEGKPRPPDVVSKKMKQSKKKSCILFVLRGEGANDPPSLGKRQSEVWKNDFRPEPLFKPKGRGNLADHHRQAEGPGARKLSLRMRNHERDKTRSR